jgi:hypothetical protein
MTFPDICRRKPRLDARSAQAGLALAGLFVAAGKQWATLTGLGATGAGVAIGAGLVAGFIIGFGAARLFGRLTELAPEIQACGLLTNPRRESYSLLYFAVPVMYDPDFVWDLVPIPEDQRYVSENATHPRCSSDGTPQLHCEIDSAVKTAAVIGSMVGAAIGALIALALVAAAFSCGIAFLVCLLVAVVVGALITYAASWLGGQLGILAGYAIDAIAGNGDLFETVEDQTCVTTAGRWVRDEDHGWNEIHAVAWVSSPAVDPADPDRILKGSCPSAFCRPDVIVE